MQGDKEEICLTLVLVQQPRQPGRTPDPTKWADFILRDLKGWPPPVRTMPTRGQERVRWPYFLLGALCTASGLALFLRAVL